MKATRKLERGYLLIADLSGYTAYLASSEPEHGPVIAGDFIESVVLRLRSVFRLVKLEGDAAFMWAPSSGIDPSMVLDAVEAAYFAFQRRLQSVTQATACTCDACRRMPQLDVKFVLHAGDVLRHRVAGREELAGRDVIVAHRLLKGTAAERAGASSYLLLSSAAVGALNLDVAALGLIPLTERYEELGEVHVYLLDLAERWISEQGRSGRARPSGSLIARLERLVPAAPETVWELLTSPARRTAWEGIARVDESAGRRGIGSTASCVVGRLETVEEILDWRPFDTFARRVVDPELGRATVVYRLSGVSTGAHVEASWFATLRSRDGPARLPAVERLVQRQSAALDRLVELVEQQDAGLPLRPVPPQTRRKAATAPALGSR